MGCWKDFEAKAIHRTNMKERKKDRGTLLGRSSDEKKKRRTTACLVIQ